MEPRTSTALSRELGDALRQARRRSKVRTGALVEQLGWSVARISKLETGTRGTSPLDIARYAGYLRPEQAAFDRIMALAHETDTGYHVRPHDMGMPDNLRTLYLHERTAETMLWYELAVVPGLVQTPSYARALMGDAHNAEQAVGWRMARQSVLVQQKPPAAEFYLYEAALHRLVGTAQVMYEQMLHLVFHGGIRLVPFTAALPVGLSGSFAHMTYADHLPVTYVEAGPVSLFLDAPEATGAYERSCAALAALALAEEESRTVFAEWADRYDRLREAQRAVDGVGVAQEQL
ncbi:helix-turn-helix domain-containing protein [Saccharothrix sp. Mg75]|uniref:helix-turn-helix domain-containing protein n=1 Tax=Saccharothrix sp. Mg75 TaxID=3445357 RepID=UPI003EF04E26